MYEYSAAGKPTVATNFSEDLHEFKDLLYIARTEDEFLSFISKAVQRSNEPQLTESLVAFARTHDWKNKTSVISDLILRNSTHS